jgi:23S rRNA (cytidine2498-2'-O)-methyltransferase
MSLELEQACHAQGLYGYVKFTKSAAFATFYFQSPEALFKVQKSLQFRHLIFARQLVFLVSKPVLLNEDDRVGAITAALPDMDMPCQTCVVESQDTEDGKALNKFCRKIAVPLRNALREQDKLYRRKFNKPIAGLCWHVCFPSAEQALVGLSIPHNRSEHEHGISRLKMPSDAPSRSTLKLEEAIHYFIAKDEHDALFREGYRATDLGACPGGWTYQLVRRGLQVEAIDNGRMQTQLMQTGLVEYYAVDGFKHRPMQGRVQWLVCDMIEQPQRVTQLMCDWLIRGDAKHAMFNLKLPMQSRFATVTECLATIQQQLTQAKIPFVMEAKHLYHNRDEVTVCIRRQD